MSQKEDNGVVGDVCEDKKTTFYRWFLKQEITPMIIGVMVGVASLVGWRYVEPMEVKQVDLFDSVYSAQVVDQQGDLRIKDVVNERINWVAVKATLESKGVSDRVIDGLPERVERDELKSVPVSVMDIPFATDTERSIFRLAIGMKESKLVLVAALAAFVIGVGVTFITLSPFSMFAGVGLACVLVFYPCVMMALMLPQGYELQGDGVVYRTTQVEEVIQYERLTADSAMYLASQFYAKEVDHELFGRVFDDINMEELMAGSEDDAYSLAKVVYTMDKTMNSYLTTDIAYEYEQEQSKKVASSKFGGNMVMLGAVLFALLLLCVRFVAKKHLAKLGIVVENQEASQASS